MSETASMEDQTVEDGELVHSPSDLQHNLPPSEPRLLQDQMDFSLSEEEETAGVRDDDDDDGIGEDDEDNLDSLVIKPPQAQVAMPSQGHPSSHRGSRENRRQQRDGHGASSDRHSGNSISASRHDKHRGSGTNSELGGVRNKHRDHRERKKHKHYDRDKERAYSKQMMYPADHQSQQQQIHYGMEMVPHHHQTHGQSISGVTSSRNKEGERSNLSHHRGNISSTSSNKHDSVDRPHHASSNTGHASNNGNKKGGGSGGSRRRGGTSGRGDHAATVTSVPSEELSGTTSEETGNSSEKQQQADRALKDLRERLLSKRVVGSGRSEGERSNRKRGTDDPGTGGGAVASDALEGEAGQLVKEIIDISTSTVQQAAAGEQVLTEEEQAEKEVRRKRLLIAEREMSRQKEQSRQERQERLERIERQRRYQQEEQRQGNAHDDNMDDVIVVTVSSENSNSDLDDDDNDSNVHQDDTNDGRGRTEHRHGGEVDIDDDDEHDGHNDDSSDSDEHNDEDNDDNDDDDERDDNEEQIDKSRDRERDKVKDRDRKHGRRHHGKVKDERGRRDRDRGRRRRDSSTDEGEEPTRERNDAAGGDNSPGVPSAVNSGGGSNNSRDKDRLRGHRDNRDSRLRRSHSPRLSRSPRSTSAHHSPHSHSPRSHSPLSRSRSRSRSPHRVGHNSRHNILLRSSRSRSRSRSPHRKSKTPPSSSNSTSVNKDQAATEKDGGSTNAKKDLNNADAIIHIDETLPPYYPALQGCRPVEEFRCLNRIEEGTYGVVYRAQDKRTKEIVALKKLKMEKEKEGFPITSLREINTLLKGQHPNIVTVREIVVGSHMDKIFIVMDYVEHDLKSLMETMRSRRQAFSPGEVKCLLRQLLMAVAHLHDNWILHRDLKTSNLLLSHRGVLKVGDFGLAREYGSPLKPYTPIVVTLWYRAPELLLCTKEYSTPIDVWSVGCIMGELVLMNALFPGKSEVEQLTKIFKELGTPNETIWPDYPNLPAVKKLHFTIYPVNSLHTRFPQMTALGRKLLQAFLTYDPKQRVTAEAALQHEYFAEQPVAIDPAMFPTWPAKSELGVGVNRVRASSPKPPSGGREYKQLGADADDPSFGFRIGISMADSRRLAAAAANSGAGSGGSGSGAPGGFSLKF